MRRVREPLPKLTLNTELANPHLDLILGLFALSAMEQKRLRIEIKLALSDAYLRGYAKGREAALGQARVKP